jgi:hypothetical protein
MHLVGRGPLKERDMATPPLCNVTCLRSDIKLRGFRGGGMAGKRMARKAADRCRVTPKQTRALIMCQAHLITTHGGGWGRDRCGNSRIELPLNYTSQARASRDYHTDLSSHAHVIWTGSSALPSSVHLFNEMQCTESKMCMHVGTLGPGLGMREVNHTCGHKSDSLTQFQTKAGNCGGVSQRDRVGNWREEGRVPLRAEPVS